ncbi:MAG TPA: hypothetical protein VK785_05750, partial [Opitutaceae bacterium]|nr:hypothetical protein [Opitutaceae bacterium]
MGTPGTSPANLELQAACRSSVPTTNNRETQSPGMPETPSSFVTPVAATKVGPSSPVRRSYRWRGKLEAVAIPTGAIIVSVILFGIFCAINGANPLAVYASIHKAAFANWYAWQETLVRAAPLMLCALCTAIP